MDDKILGRLIDEQASALELYARQWCDCPGDVVQDALLQLVRQRKPPERVVAWLYKVVRNRAISVGRSNRRRRRHETQSTLQNDRWFVSSQENHLDAKSAAAALQRLTLEQREVIVARLWGELSFEDIAELTGTSSSTAHRRYQAGLTSLREKLGISLSENESCPRTTSDQTTTVSEK